MAAFKSCNFWLLLEMESKGSEDNIYLQILSFDIFLVYASASHLELVTTKCIEGVEEIYLTISSTKTDKDI